MRQILTSIVTSNEEYSMNVCILRVLSGSMYVHCNCNSELSYLFENWLLITVLNSTGSGQNLTIAMFSHFYQLGLI